MILSKELQDFSESIHFGCVDQIFIIVGITDLIGCFTTVYYRRGADHHCESLS